MYRKYRPKTGTLAILTLLFLYSCTAGTPEIISIDTAFESRLDTFDNSIQSNPFILITASDPDGSLDIKSIELYRAGDEQFWYVDRNQFQMLESKGQALILIRNLMQDSEVYTGKITAKLFDRAGNTSSRVFSLLSQPPAPTASDRMPRILQNAETLTITGPGIITVRAVDYEGKVLLSKDLPPGEISLAELGFKDQGGQFLQYFAQYWSEEDQTLYTSGPW